MVVMHSFIRDMLFGTCFDVRTIRKKQAVFANKGDCLLFLWPANDKVRFFGHVEVYSIAVKRHKRV